MLRVIKLNMRNDLTIKDYINAILEEYFGLVESNKFAKPELWRATKRGHCPRCGVTLEK